MGKVTNLYLDETAIKELPSSINNLTGLVTLNLKGCRELKFLPSCMSMESLEQLDLSGCQNLDKFPEIAEVMKKLTWLSLSETAIKELPSSINNLTGLVTLNLKGCKELKILPNCISMESLEQLDLSGCSNLAEFPEISKVMGKLTNLYLDETAIKELPSSINNLTGLVRLYLKGCRELKILPSCIFTESLEELDLCSCQNLDKFPEIAEVMKKLTWLSLSETAIKELPSSINNLTGLVTLNLKGCKELKILPNCISMESLKTLHLSGCQNLDKFPEISEVMKKLTWLSLSETAIKELPSSINNLTGLVTLNLKGCKELKILPNCISMESLEQLDLSGCSNLAEFPEISEVMGKLTNLYLDETAIKELPSSINNLTGLVRLYLKGCRELKILPSCIFTESLEELDLCSCQNLDKFPEIAEVMKKLTWLSLSETAIKELPSSINNLTGLVTLNLKGCKELKILPNCISMESLKTLHLSGCQNLDKFPEISEVMKKLTWLSLSETAIKELPSSINNLTGLVTLNLKGCKELKILPNCISMESLEQLDLSGCSNLAEFPEISEVMGKLTNLYLDETAIKELPSSINNLTGLVRLYLKGCRELKILPSCIFTESLEELDLCSCQNLDKFPEIAEVMKKLTWLSLNETAIKVLPSSIEQLQELKLISMRNCRSLVCLPGSICNLAHLTFLDLSGCTELSSLPENIGSLNSLTELEVQDSGIKQLPFSFSLLRGLRISLSRNGLNALKIPISEWWSSISLSQHTDHVRHLDLSDCNLLELSESIAHLYSLESLTLCRNKFESLPATMNRLGRLINLRLEACDRLKSIPELSSSINYIDAHDCISLETVSKPKPQYHTKHFFTFSNCFQLVQTNLFRDIVERHSHFQDNFLRLLRLKMSHPGDEVPDWFDHQSRGFSVSVQLPPNWFDSKFLGFAICAVRTHWGSPVPATCLCTFKGDFGECSFRFDLIDSDFTIDRSLGSDHMFLGYVSWSECPLIEEGRLVNETYTEATFQIAVESEFIIEQLLISSCGVRLIYANPDEMLNLSVTQPRVLANSCGTGVTSMDPCEITETERAEITEVSREVESSEAREGRDTCHRLQLFPELLELGNDSGLPVPEPQVREEERGAGHRLQLFPELSELGSHSGLPVPEPQVREKKRKSPWGFQ
ncbi:hypothetical protein M0R45_037941 [Rubus argutus]|uniref:Uncharacterized protein n=1 Tax=Rubus argutus TaxID=59490 RepID=A0AAW1W1J0_RUBAR